jgi:mannose-6-phosphate isomerase
MAFWQFAPIYRPRVWGGRRLEGLWGRALPPGERIGESWELCDRPEAQSRVVGQEATLGDLWRQARRRFFGTLAPTRERFPLLIKVLDCREATSIQLHPGDNSLDPRTEGKWEAWYFLQAEGGAGFHAGIRRGVTGEDLIRCLGTASLPGLLHWIPSHAGLFFWNPPGRIHALGGGNLVFEVQQNSDTTYRLYDWERSRPGERNGLDLEAAAPWVGVEDVEPQGLKFEGPFRVDLPFCTFWRSLLPVGGGEIWNPDGRSFLYHFLVKGRVMFADHSFGAGQGWLVSADHPAYTLQAVEDEALVVTIGFSGMHQARYDHGKVLAVRNFTPGEARRDGGKDP